MRTDDVCDDELFDRFLEWDEGSAREGQCEALGKVAYFCRHLCIEYSFEEPYTKWSQVTAPAIYDRLKLLPHRKNAFLILQEMNASKQKVLEGVEYWRALGEDAQKWVSRILKDHHSSLEQASMRMNGDDVCEWLDEITYKSCALMRMRLESPLLFGQVCVEMELNLNSIRDQAEASATS
jgi:hypothetical protein